VNPTIYLTNFSSRRLHGPGAVYTMMGAPRAFEQGQGRVQNLRPHGADELRLMRAALAERKAGQTGDALARYRRALETRWTHQAGLLAPGALLVKQRRHCIVRSRRAQHGLRRGQQGQQIV